MNEVRRCEEMDRKLRMYILILYAVHRMSCLFKIKDTSPLNKRRKPTGEKESCNPDIKMNLLYKSRFCGI